MKPTELLRETERALSDKSVCDFLGKHDELITLKDSMRALEAKVTNQRDELAKLTTLNSALEREVERHREREQLIRDIDTISKKLPWAEYEMQKKTYLECKENKEAAKQNLAAKQKQLQACVKPVEQKKKAFSTAKQKMEDVCGASSPLHVRTSNAQQNYLNNRLACDCSIRRRHDIMKRTNAWAKWRKS